MDMAKSDSLLRPGLGATQPPSSLFIVKRAVPPVSKRLGNEAENSPPDSDEAKNEWSYNFTSPCVFMPRTEITLSLHSSETCTQNKGKTL